MSLKYLWIISIFKIYLTSCTVFLWSNKKVDVLPLQKFSDDDFALLLEKMDYPEVMAYTNPNQNIPLSFKELVHGSFSAFNTNEDLIGINTTDLSGNEEADFLRIKEDLDRVRKGNRDALFVILSAPNQRTKRETDEEELVTENPDEPKGSVVYVGKSKTDERYGIIYSSSPLILKINKTELPLGETSSDMISVDTVPRESITRLNINIPQDDGRKIIIRFIFSWVNDYWYLTSVRISDTSYNIGYNLTIDKDVTAPAQFSYHCSGSTVFSDPSNDVYLYLSDMQVQIYSKKGSFDDAYDCISFTTVPIWSGIFVSSLLIVVLMLSLIALGDIKTMDKFDNQKTKQLTITVNE